MYFFFRSEDRGRWACLKYINAQNSALWIILVNPDSYYISAVVGLSFNGAPVHDVYLAQFSTLIFTLPFPAQSPRSAPTPEQMTGEWVTDWTKDKFDTRFCGCFVVFVLSQQHFTLKKLKKRQGVFIEDIWNLIKAVTGTPHLWFYIPPTAAQSRWLHCRPLVAFISNCKHRPERSPKVILKTTQRWKLELLWVLKFE